MPLRLRIIPSPSPSLERAVDFDDGVGQIRIGRRADLELSLPYSPLSGVHARLVRASDSEKKTDHWVLEDLGSTNGTYVGGERLKPGIKHPLTAGTQIKLAEIKLIFDGEVRDVRSHAETVVQAAPPAKSTGKVLAEASSKSTSKVLAEASSKSIGKVQAEVPNSSSGKVQAEASNKVTGKTVSEVSSRPSVKPPVDTSSKSDVKSKSPVNEPTETYVRRQLTDVVAAGPSVAQVPHLKAVGGVGGDTTFRLEQRDHEYLFGRTRRCEFRVDVQEVSREHASFTRRSDGIYVNDLGSVNGVLVNNTRVKDYRLFDGDLIQIGHVKLRLIDPTDPSRREAERSASASQSAFSRGTPAHSMPAPAVATRDAAKLDALGAHAHVEPPSATFRSELHPAIAGALAVENPGEYRQRRPSVRIRLQETWEASNKFRYVIVIVGASLLAFVAVMIGFRLAD